MQKMKLLLVDDEENFVNTLAERLEMRGLKANVVLNGEMALEYFIRGDVPDVIVLDLKMPGIDGVEVLRRVKKLNPSVQVIILTGHGTDKDEDLTRELGAFEYHRKPVDIEKLMKSIKGAYRERLESMMVAAAFAQAGAFEEAKDILKEDE